MGARLRHGLRRSRPHLFTIHAMSAHVALAVGLLAWTLFEREAVAQREAARQRAAVAQPAAARAAAASSRLSGRVVSIAAGSIADAVVTLTRIDPSAPAPLTIASDRQGAFTFEGVPAGRYRVSASKSGYTNRQPLHASADRFDTGRELTL